MRGGQGGIEADGPLELFYGAPDIALLLIEGPKVVLRLGLGWYQLFHLKELVKRLLNLTCLLVLDAQIEVSVGQRPVKLLRLNDLGDSFLALAGAQESKPVIEVFLCRAGVQLQCPG